MHVIWERTLVNYGFKVQVITTENGLPVQFYIHAGSFTDISALKAMLVDLPQNSKLYGDSGYTFYETEDLFYDYEKVALSVCRKSNSKRKAPSSFFKKLLPKTNWNYFLRYYQFLP